MNFTPVLNLDAQELADLASILPHPGMKVLQKIGRSCVDQFAVSMINAEMDDDVLRKHKYAKVAAQLLTAIVNRVNQEVQDYAARPRVDDPPLDIAKDLDIGDTAEELEELF